MHAFSTNTDCPRCASNKHVRPKLLLIEEFNAEHFRRFSTMRLGCDCQGEFNVDGLKPEAVVAAPLEQFVTGLFCDACGIGFVPEEMAKPLAPRWKMTRDGFCLIQPDGSLGPPQPRMNSSTNQA